MDEYGGPAAPPRPPKPAARVHRPAASARRPSTTAASAPTTVSLLRPRPETEREANAYVEAPSRCSASATAAGARLPPPPAGKRPVTTQPPPADKRHTQGGGAEGGGGGGGQLPDSIVCSECGRCRCEQCARPRQLPQRWLCGSCLCSCEAAVDYASCMCCVKAFLYHCGGGGGEREEEVEPCGCSGGGGGGGGWRATGARLLCLAALALPLPCLVAYWPLRGCAACTQALYARATNNGCRCRHPPTHRHSSSII